MSRTLLAIFYIIISVLPCLASTIVYLRVPATGAPAILERLNSLITITETTLRYTTAQNPVIATSTADVIISVEDEERVRIALADNVLWNQRLATIPVEFVPPMPTTGGL